MAKVSRFKQPAFDPRELDDLIHVPAVGTGVGSHLLTRERDFPALLPVEPQLSVTSDLTTVDTLKRQPIQGLSSAASILKHLQLLRAPSGDLSTVATFEKPMETTGKSTATKIEPDVSTVATSLLPTVDRFETKIEHLADDRPEVTTVDRFAEQPDLSNEQGGVGLYLPTVDTFSNPGWDGSNTQEHVLDLSTVATSRYPHPLWFTEDGVPIAHGRVRQIRLAQDVINSAEESVYDELWKAKGAVEAGDCRVVQAGYDYLVKRTRLARKTIQRIVAKLIDKDFIAIERPADIYERSATTYRVFSYRSVLERHKLRGRTHVAKIGPGFSYVQRVQDPRQQHVDSNMSTVVTSHMSTVDSEATVTVGTIDVSTVVRETTSLLGNKNLRQLTSSSLVQEALNIYGVVDDDVCVRLTLRCRQETQDCTEEEIVSYIHEKGRLLRSGTIRNPMGFFLESVPKCFASKQYRDWQQAKKDAAGEAAEAESTVRAEQEERRADYASRLADPNIPEAEKALIRRVLEAGN